MGSNAAFAVATVELLSRIWVELDQLPDAAAPVDRGPRAPAASAQCETLRLELVLLIDSCHSLRWRGLMDGQQRLYLKAILEDVLDALATADGGADRAEIERAQNRLLDAVLEQRSAWSAEPRVRRSG